MRMVTDINSRQELEEMKSIMEIFVISYRIKQIAGTL